MSRINTILLAAGKSSRINQFSGGLPKPLIPIDGVPIIFRNLKWLNSFSSIDSVWINLHYQHEFMRNEIEKFSTKINNLKLHFIYEDNILGTAGALANVAQHWSKKSHHLVIYGDNLLNFDLNSFIDTHFSKKNLITLALFDEQKNLHTGIAGGKVFLDDNNYVTKFIEGKKNSPCHYVNAGIYLLAPEIISNIPLNQFCDFGKDIFPAMLLKNIPLYGYIIDGYCLGLDTPECFAVAYELINKKKVVLL